MCWPFDRVEIGSSAWSHRVRIFPLRWSSGELLQNVKESGEGQTAYSFTACTEVLIIIATSSTCWTLASPDLASLFPGSISSTCSKSSEEQWHTETCTHRYMYPGSCFILPCLASASLPSFSRAVALRNHALRYVWSSERDREQSSSATANLWERLDTVPLPLHYCTEHLQNHHTVKPTTMSLSSRYQVTIETRTCRFNLDRAREYNNFIFAQGTFKCMSCMVLGKTTTKQRVKQCQWQHSLLIVYMTTRNAFTKKLPTQPRPHLSNLRWAMALLAGRTALVGSSSMALVYLSTAASSFPSLNNLLPWRGAGEGEHKHIEVHVWGQYKTFKRWTKKARSGWKWQEAKKMTE